MGAETLRVSLEAPSSEQSHSWVPPQHVSFPIHTPLTHSHQNQSLCFLPFVQASPSPGHTVWGIGAAGSMWGRDTWMESDLFCFHLSLAPYQSLAHMGAGKPQSCSPHATQLCCQLGLLWGEKELLTLGQACREHLLAPRSYNGWS
jgi:hypothetical protein